jgi:hypothetical protein
MSKKVVAIVVAVIILFLGGVFVGMRRSQMMGGTSQAGNLHAVTAAGDPLPVPASAGNLPENTALQEAGGMRVTFALSPYPPSGGQATNFEVTLVETSTGQAISDATVALDMTMPAMPMPANQPSLEPGAAGQYQGASRFTMRGLWRIEVIITRGGQTQSVFFDLDL